MAWIEVHQSLRDHRKILALADELDMPEPHVAGHCLYLWLWSLDNAPDGVLPKSDRIIAKAAGWNGTASTFVTALVSVGMLDLGDDLTLRIHDWDDYAGKIADRRERNKLAMRATREREKLERVQHVDTTSTSRDATSKATVPNPTIHNTTIRNRVSGVTDIKMVGKDGSASAKAPPRRSHQPTNHTAKDHKDHKDQKDEILGSLPDRVRAQFVPEQIAEEYDKALRWYKHPSRDHPMDLDVDHFADWLLRIPAEKRQKAEESEVERIARILTKRPDERGLIDGRTGAAWASDLTAARQEEERVRSAERQRIKAALCGEEAEVVQQNGVHPPAADR